jgi:hypothetical protein
VREVLGLSNRVSEASEPVAQDSPVINIDKDKGKKTDTPKKKHIARSRHSTRLKAGTSREAKITDNEEVAADKSANNRGPKITDNEEVAADKSEEYGFLQTPKIDKIQEALKSSTMELKAVVNDPLPDAIHAPDTLVPEMARNNENVTPLNLSDDNNPTSLPNHNFMDQIVLLVWTR